ncbi:hypothetical protein COY28_02790, partial [Candidatus Woesearchaeota archaeon CG_4_10_14_0_2_um_filter_57_5]
PEAVALIGILRKNRKKVSEFKLAALSDMDIKTVRNILYKLFHVNLVTYTRRKDRQKGWYIYSWIFNKKRVPDLYISLKHQKIEKLRGRLEKERTGQFYICPDLTLRMDFEHAMNFDFRCPECGKLLMPVENDKTISNIEAQVAELEKILAKVDKKQD